MRLRCSRRRDASLCGRTNESRQKGWTERRGGKRQMFSSSPTSNGDPLLFNAGTLRMSGGKTWQGERRREREREREGARKGKHCWNLCKIRSSWTPRVRVLDIQRVFLTRYHPFLPFLFLSSIRRFSNFRSISARWVDKWNIEIRKCFPLGGKLLYRLCVLNVSFVSTFVSRA